MAITEMKPKKKQTEREQCKIMKLKVFMLYSDNLMNNEKGIDSEFEEFCLINIKTTNQISMLFGCFYRSPTQHINYQTNNLDLLKRLSSTNQYKHRCFCGDFNFWDIKWSDCTTTKNEDSVEYLFIETIRDCFLQ